jgi:hypothetical protein
MFILLWIYVYEHISNVKVLLIYMYSKKQAGKPCIMFFAIAEVVPAILKIINNWEITADSTGISKSIKHLCKLLLDQFKKRFHYEMKCDIYRVKKNYEF